MTTKDDYPKFEMDMVKIIAREACIKINPHNPRAVAEAIGDMYEALKWASEDIENGMKLKASTETVIFKALNKAGGGKE